MVFELYKKVSLFTALFFPALFFSWKNNLWKEYMLIIVFPGLSQNLSLPEFNVALSDEVFFPVALLNKCPWGSVSPGNGACYDWLEQRSSLQSSHFIGKWGENTEHFSKARPGMNFKHIFLAYITPDWVGFLSCTQLQLYRGSMPWGCYPLWIL